jgi:hypothetical protein
MVRLAIARAINAEPQPGPAEQLDGAQGQHETVEAAEARLVGCKIRN